jgi:hypothetical protein
MVQRALQLQPFWRPCKSALVDIERRTLRFANPHGAPEIRTGDASDRDLRPAVQQPRGAPSSCGHTATDRPYKKLSEGNLLSVLGFELLVPGNPEEDALRALREAVEVSSEQAYHDARRALFQWQRRFVRNEHTDGRSIKAAVDEMTDLVAKLREANGRAKMWKGLKRFFSFVSTASKVAALAPPVTAIATSGDAIAAAVDSWSMSEQGDATTAIPAATLVADARERLGID